MKQSYLITFIFFLFAITTQTEAQSLEDKIGQMIMVGVENDQLSQSTLIEDLEQRNLGGVLLFGYNIDNPTQVRNYTSDLQTKSDERLLIAVDQEGGIVARLDETNGYAQTYSAETLGFEFNSEDSTRAVAQLMAHWLSDAGFTFNLAPVVDLRINPNSPAIGFLDRSFSADPETVVNHASWFIEEFHSRNIATALKHFPGHGSAETDSHLGFTDITNTWKSVELDPFKQLIDNGYNDPIMTGHLYNEDWDTNYPVSLSEYAITIMLRDSLGFDGVVITDELFMRALSNNYGLEETIVTTINAGTDILLFNTNIWNNQSLVEYIINLVVDRISDGTIQESTINESYARIKWLKQERIPTSSDEIVESSELPASFRIQNYPNPFNPSTTITVSTLERSNVRISVHDALGREVRLLQEGQLQRGVHTIRFDGGRLSSGVYFVMVRSPSSVKTHAITLVK
ncbi:glycoside hydrolase family 3 N-terminal domain-containing protein [Rhodohalobacter sp. 8-1]|uniref:glycoside hydrolase family 3 N-terminal domain-containing protein n=1 Tax=Rhodohalobacter sp. 8-1 TaxID=3131972 RepID=UPI0030EBDA1C